MKNIYVFFVLLITNFAPVLLHGQTPFANTVQDIVLTGGPGSGTNRSGVAFNPQLRIYYANVAGNMTFPFETFSETGTLLNTVTSGIDVRGVWWNPLLNQLEMNTFSSQGIYSRTLDANGYATGTTVGIQTPTNVQPNTQSFGQYDWVNNHFVYYNNGSIIRVNRATNAIVSTNVVTGLPATSITDFSVGFFNVPNYELALYDYTNRRVYFVNGSTYAYTATTQLPLTALGPNWFNVAWSNNRIFLCNTSARTWHGYPLFPDGCDTVFYEQKIDICSNQFPFNWNGKIFTSGGSMIDTFHWPAASVACDSVTYLTLNVKEAYSSYVSDSMYEGNVYVFGTNTLYNSGIYDHVFTASNGCDSSIRLHLKVIPLEFKIMDTTICEYDQLEFYSKVYNRAGFHSDTFILDDRHLVLRLNLNIRKKPTIKMELEGKSFDGLCIGEPITFVPSGALRYEWYKYEETHRVKYFTGQVLKGYVYDSTTQLMIRGIDELGCFNDLYYDISGKNCCQYFIPNAFTPNGDGVNDMYQVIGIQPRNFRMLVFNKYGNLVFQSESVDATWSGQDRLGNALASDVYYYHITGQCFDGTEINEKGDITLLR